MAITEPAPRLSS